MPREAPCTARLVFKSSRADHVLLDDSCSRTSSAVRERACAADGGGVGGRSVAGPQCARLLRGDERPGRLQDRSQGHLVADATRGPPRLAGCRCCLLGALPTLPAMPHCLASGPLHRLQLVRRGCRMPYIGARAEAVGLSLSASQCRYAEPEQQHACLVPRRGPAERRAAERRVRRAGPAAVRSHR